MQQQNISKVVIVGGGTSGWMTAAALSKFLDLKKYNITLVESDQIATVGVGEATLPHLRHFNQTLGIDENDFMRETNATYKIGIEFSHWGQIGDSYIHPFGDYGQSIDNIAFHQFWNALRLKGYPHSIDEFSLPVLAARKNKFDYPAQNSKSILSTYSYAFHLDAGLYSQYLRKYSEQKGIKRTEGKMIDIVTSNNGNIEALKLDSGQLIEGDLFIDCTGMRALLIGKTLNTPYKDWSHWLPCDRAVAVPSTNTQNPPPYTKAMAQDNGWQWRIPLQHRTGNGLVYSSKFLSDQEAIDSLMSNLEGDALAEPFTINFNVGHREKSWSKNCIAIGLSAGFLEPLESTGLHLIQSAITQLLELFPRSIDDIHARNEFNRIMKIKFDSVRDFLILHYHSTKRNDTEFWNYCRTMEVPNELKFKMDLFKNRGHVVENPGELFLEPSWVAVYFGQGVSPSGYDPRVEAYDLEEIESILKQDRKAIISAVSNMTNHQTALTNNCKSDAKKLWPEASLNLYGRKG